MLKFTLLLILFFLTLLALRALRLLLAAVLRRRPLRHTETGRVEGEMVRDPVCGVWIDRRLAIGAGSEAGAVAVCSEECRRAVEQRFAP